MTKEWKIARTMAHLHINGNYAGISVSLKSCTPTERAEPPSPPKKGG